jgi:muconate cycloisomerase
VRDAVECSGWTGRRTPQDAGRKAREAVDRGHKVFKFKCAADDGVADWARSIESVCGSSIRLLLDPNQRWSTVENTMQMMRDVPRNAMFGLEDPIERNNLAGLRLLRRRLEIPIFVHISMPYSQPAGDLVTALKEDAVDGFNFNGPMFRFVDLALAASFGGVPCWHGSEVDLGILEASALHACAAAEGCTLPSDIFGELVREDDLIVEPLQFNNGSFRVPAGPGLGVELDEAALQRYVAGEVLQ